MMTEQDLKRRALADWYRKGGGDDATASVKRHRPVQFAKQIGRRQLVYVVVRSKGKVAVVYRLQGIQLRRLKRWPAEVEGA